jgi:transposase-like protein
MAKRKRVQRDWPAVVQAYAASGLSVTAFCRDQGISTSLLYSWRQRYPPGTESSTSSAGFVELLPVDQPASSGVALVVDGGLRLEVEPGFDAATLEQVLACVERRTACSP